MSRKTTEELEEMRRPIINKVVRQSENEILINDHMYLLEKDYRDAFNEEMLAERFVGLFSRYDYVVGDLASDQLRLKGFYEDTAHVPIEFKISRLEDYLLEDCSFGCPYFVLRNTEVNERARQRWEKSIKTNPKGRTKNVKKSNTPSKPVAKRKNEVVGVGKKKNRKTFTIREKK